MLGVLLALIFAFFLLFSPAPVAEARLRKFTLPTNSEPSRPRISPNGRHVAYLTGPDHGRTLWVQDLDQTQPRSIVGPEAIRDTAFAWSPDSRFIAFRGEDELKKVSVSGGPVVSLCEAIGSFAGIAWTPESDSIIFTSRNRLFEVSARGGEPELFLEAEAQEEGQALVTPMFATTGEGAVALLYVQGTTVADAQIVAFDPSSGRREPLLPGGLPTFAPSGHLVYDRLNPRGIWAVPFSVGMMKTTGEPFPISENGTLPSVSLDGTLVYLEVPAGTGLKRLVWRDRKGNVLGSIGQPQPGIRQPALSPDGKRIAVLGIEDGERDIWIHDVDRPIKTRLTTHEGPDFWPTWSSRGDSLAFASGRTGGRDIYLKQGDGSGEAIPLLLTEGTNEYPTDWSRDGSTLLFFRLPTGAGGTGYDIFYLRDKGNGNYEEVAFLTTPFDEITPQLSPDKRFIAYVSNESGAKEVYLQGFPGGGNRRRVSVNGGSAPRWHSGGSELFYVEGETLMAAPVSTSPTLTVGSPEVLFSASGLTFNQGTAYGYDLTPEGDKFITWETVEADTDAQPVIRVVQNWYEEFRDREQD